MIGSETAVGERVWNVGPNRRGLRGVVCFVGRRLLDPGESGQRGRRSFVGGKSLIVSDRTKWDPFGERATPGEVRRKKVEKMVSWDCV
ncbi:hypothetical protein TNCV_2636471 [Trichonephila clavipes]|uniref:Uncharacterized protein n=1 Tax=Trichonephila clavipes TaxID=2585209 RepID=A0A8X6R706_TRICX|nr:hypothetical protein TNCV_2636471 [Trichonephila clavipes]